MKRLLAVIFTGILLFSSCAPEPAQETAEVVPTPSPAISPTRSSPRVSEPAVSAPAPEPTKKPISKKNLADETDVEALFCFENIYWAEDRDDREEILRRSVRASFSDEKQKSQFVEEYLREWSTYKESPDGAMYNRGKIRAEYYVDTENQSVSFVLHVWGDTFEDQIDLVGDNEYIGVCCVTVRFDDFTRTGSHAYTYDSEKNNYCENLYDVDDVWLADVSYQYTPGIPFPVVTKQTDADELNASMERMMEKNQRLWLYADLIDTDEREKWAGFSGCVFDPFYYGIDYEHIEYPFKDHYCTFFYDTKGRVESIREELRPSERDADFERTLGDSGQMVFRYREDGRLRSTAYSCAVRAHGNWDCSGVILYDEAGRMIHGDYYASHGAHSWIQLYNGDAQRPWVNIDVGGIAHGGDDVSEYGFEVIVNLFVPLVSKDVKDSLSLFWDSLTTPLHG